MHMKTLKITILMLVSLVVAPVAADAKDPAAAPAPAVEEPTATTGESAAPGSEEPAAADEPSTPDTSGENAAGDGTSGDEEPGDTSSGDDASDDPTATAAQGAGDDQYQDPFGGGGGGGGGGG